MMMAHVADFCIMLSALSLGGAVDPDLLLGLWGGTIESHPASRGAPRRPKTKKSHLHPTVCSSTGARASPARLPVTELRVKSQTSRGS